MARLVLLPRTSERAAPRRRRLDGARAAVASLWRSLAALLWRLNGSSIPLEVHHSDIEQSLRVTYG